MEAFLSGAAGGAVVLCGIVLWDVIRLVVKRRRARRETLQRWRDYQREKAITRESYKQHHL